MLSSNSEKSNISLKVGMFVGVAIAILFLSISIFHSLPSNVVATRQGEPLRVFSLALAPQSWAFFTKDPIEEEFYVLKRESETWVSASVFPQSRPENLFGISRNQRSQGVEFAIISQKIDDWTSCKELSWNECIKSVKDPANSSIDNTSKSPTICGDVLLLITEPITWSYKEFSEDLRFVDKYARVTVDCS